MVIDYIGWELIIAGMKKYLVLQIYQKHPHLVHLLLRPLHPLQVPLYHLHLQLENVQFLYQE
jgi:hypothetical protein